ncbi:MAG: hypothetical protein KC416_15295, partial [Myxococcales bacterium]|nr:hypothetical protein [Myxococcales bacterium]
ARRGAVRAVLGPGGEDRVEEALLRAKSSSAGRLPAIAPLDSAESEAVSEAIADLRRAASDTGGDDGRNDGDGNPADASGEAEDLQVDSDPNRLVSMDGAGRSGATAPLPTVAPDTQASDEAEPAPVEAPEIAAESIRAALPTGSRAAPGGGWSPAWFLLLPVLAWIGYQGGQILFGVDDGESTAIRSVDGVALPVDAPRQGLAATAPAPSSAEGEGPATVEDGFQVRPPEPSPAAAIAGKLVPGMELEGAGEAGPGEGVLRIRHRSGRPPAGIRIDGRDLGAPPLSVALREGRYRVAFILEDEERYRFWYVKAGHTRIVDSP